MTAPGAAAGGADANGSPTDSACRPFLQWALPRLGRRWAGYRKVRRLVCRRLGRRCRALGLGGLEEYRAWLESHPAEWLEFDGLLGIPISRFLRDRAVFESIRREVLPAAARRARAAARATIDCWSAGCAAGEEPYTLAILWRLCVQAAFPELLLRIVATDCDAALLERARAGCYGESSLRELPLDLRDAAFERRGPLWCVRPELRAVGFRQQDLRSGMPDGPFDLVLCRNVVATYYAPAVQRQVFEEIGRRLRPGGALVLGIHEVLPDGTAGFAPWPGARAIWRRRGRE